VSFRSCAAGLRAVGNLRYDRSVVSFPGFRIDVAEERLWKGTKLLAVRRKPFAILSYLVANPRRLVTHDELLERVWGGTVVSESSVRTHLHELRQVLGDGIIETVIGRGYRFTQEVTLDEDAPAAPRTTAIADRIIVGREPALEVLRGALERARGGQRQLVFVTGEPGIGKTLLVDAFLDELAGVVAVRGQCVEQHSTPEAYRPVIDILGQLRHSKFGDQALAALVRYAPTFLAHMPQLVPDGQLAEVMKRAGGGSEARMVRELIEALETLCVTEPLVVVLEDLQWSDVATLDLLSLLGQRRERAKLLVIATSRRAEAQTVSHPLNRVMRALVARSGAIALPIDRLDGDEIAALVAARFPGHAFPASLCETIENVTAGTPLFVTAVLDDLVERGMIAGGTLAVPLAEVAAHRPDNLKQLIDIQLDRLTAHEQRLLEVASIIGSVFATALVAAALEMPIEQADELCDGLARRSLFLQHEGTEDWPDGSQQSCYGFTHGLVQDVCGDRSAPARRQRWHRAIAERLEAAYGARAGEVSTTLAQHYEKAQVLPRAIHFHFLTAERMMQRFASYDALPSFRRALELLKRTPETRERDEQELRILGGMGSSVLRGLSDANESIARFDRMIALARKLGDSARLCSVLVSKAVRYATLAKYDLANETNAELAALAPSLPGELANAINAARALPLIWQGKLADAIAVLEPITRPEARTEEDTRVGILDPVARKTVLIGYLGAMYAVIGDTARGLAEMERAGADAAATGDPFTIGLTTVNGARIRYLRGDPVAPIRAAAEAVLANRDAQIWHVQAALLVDWARSVEAPLPAVAVDDMLRKFRERTSDIPMGASYVAITVVDALRRSHRVADAEALADSMIAASRASGEMLFFSELLRIRGALYEATDAGRAVAMYREAIEHAEAIGAHLLALRAALDLAKHAPERDFLARILANVADRDTPIVREAQRLLA
jgi:DNA-binding winged helix-turn-helix (wHTH) protein